MTSPRVLLGVYQNRDGHWQANIKQGCIIEHVIVLRFTSALDETAERIANKRAQELMQ